MHGKNTKNGQLIQEATQKNSVNPTVFRCNIYILRLCYDVSVRLSVRLSVCDGSALWSRCMPGRGEGSSRAILATARPLVGESGRIGHDADIVRQCVPGDRTRMRKRTTLAHQVLRRQFDISLNTWKRHPGR